MKLSIKGQGHSLTLVKGHLDFKAKCLNFGLYTQVSNSGPHGPLVYTSTSLQPRRQAFPVSWRRRLFCFGSLVILDVACCYLSLFSLYINIKIGKNIC